MGTFEVVRTVRAGRAKTFEVVADLRAHGDYVPLTRVEHDPGPIGVGWRFTGRTGVGPLTLVDRMEVTRWEPGESFRIDKRGPVLDGWAEVHFTCDGPDTRVVWHEHILVRPRALGRLLAPVLDPGNRVLFTRVLGAMAARAEHA